MIVELIARNAGESQEESQPYYPRPSSVGKCIRALVYHAMGVRADPFPDRAILVFEDGNWAEEIIKDHIRKTVFELEEWKGSRQRIKIAEINGRLMTGEIDGLLIDPLGQIYLLEIKSINHFGFERLKDGPLDDHRRQANLYMHGLIEAGFNIRRAIIIYKNKNTAAMKEFIIEYDAIQALADISMFEVIDDFAKRGELPARPYNYDDWHCQYCRWEKPCWEGYVQEVEKLSTNVALDEELETTARYYTELGAQESEIKKERKVLHWQICEALKESGAQSGRAGEYLISLSVAERKAYIDALVPPEAIKRTFSERLNVKSLIKKGTSNENHQAES